MRPPFPPRTTKTPCRRVAPPGRMRRSDRGTPLVALILGALLAPSLLLAPAPAAAHAPGAPPEDGVVPLSLASEDPDGVRVYRVSNPAGLGVVRYWVNGTMTLDYRPWHVQLVQPSGSVFPFYADVGVTSDGDLSGGGAGDGAVYAGGPGGSVQAPALRPYEEPLAIFWRDHPPGTDGWLVVAWANQPDPISFDFHWPAGTSVSFEAEGVPAAYELKDFQGGVRAGAPLAVAVNAGDSLTFQPAEGQLWGYFFVWRSTGVGHGRLVVDRAGDGLHREMSFDALPTTGCVCTEWHRWSFTSASELTARLDLLGDGPRTEVFVVVATLPAGTLPADVWSEHADARNP